MTTLVGKGAHSLHETGAGAADSVVSDEALARLVKQGDSELQRERAGKEVAGILDGLASILSRPIGSFQVRNSRVITPSSRDGTIQSVRECMRVDVSEGPELFDAVYVRGDIEIDDNNRPLSEHSEELTIALGAQALLHPTPQVEYLYPEWFLG